MTQNFGRAMRPSRTYYSISEMKARSQAKGRLYITGHVQFIEGN